MSHHRHRYYESSDSDDLPDIRRLRTEDDRGRRRKDNVNVFLNVPGGKDDGGRRRSTSTGGQPQPKIYVNNITEGGARSPSRRRDSSSEGESRHGHHRRDSSRQRDSSYERWKRERELDEIERERERRRKAVEYEAEEAQRKKDKERRRIQREFEMQQEEDEREREKIIREAEVKKKEKELADKALKEKIKAELAAEEAKKKAEKEAREKELEHEMKDKLLEAGYTSKQADDIIHNKRHADRHGDHSQAIERHRPTFIKVKRKYLLPATLEHYGLAWEFDPHDDDYIVIKEWIDHDFQEVLFEHTRKIKETRLITPGYTKETVTVLKPTEAVVKKQDQLYLVRKKSRSRSRDRRSGGWMFS